MSAELNRRYALLNLGGTIGEIYAAGGLARRSTARMLLASADLPDAWPGYDVALIDSVDATFSTLALAASLIADDRLSAGFILCCGTDMLEEIAYAAALLLPPGRPIVVTAAALPASEPGADGPANLRRAASLLASGAAVGTMVVMGDAIFAATGIVKAAAQAMQPFAAPDGPIGHFRGGAPRVFAASSMDDAFRTLGPSDCQARVAILHECFGGTDLFIDPAALDGLVVASAGAGGLNRQTLALLRERYLPVMPVVLATRCPSGYSLNPGLPKYDLTSARADGFRLDAFTELSAPQARIRLILEIGLSRRKEQRS